MTKAGKIGIIAGGIGFTGLLILVVVLLYKRRGSTTAMPKELDWGDNLSESESNDIYRIAKALYEDMDGLSMSHNNAIYTEYAATPDRVFVGVANYFAQRWGNGDNLATWLDGEVYGASNKATVKSILVRLNGYGITPK